MELGMLEGAGELIGGAAAFLTTVSFVPQFLKAWKTKSTKDISLRMFVLFTIGVLCWLIYGLILDSIPMIAANIVTLILAIGILGCKLKYG